MKIPHSGKWALYTQFSIRKGMRRKNKIIIVNIKFSTFLTIPAENVELEVEINRKAPNRASKTVLLGNKIIL